MIVSLRHVPMDYWTPWHVVAPEPWEDEVTKRLTDYLAGFSSRAAALAWIERRGWSLADEGSKTNG